MHDIIDQDAVIIWATILFGSIVHATSQLKTSRDSNKPFNIVDFIILFLIACFSWMVFGLVALMFNFGMVQIILSSAIWSFMGLVGLDKIANMVLDLILTRKMWGKWPTN